VGAELAGALTQHAGGQELGDFGQALRGRELLSRAAHGVDLGTGLRFRSPGDACRSAVRRFFCPIPEDPMGRTR
jgi:hypothetical protein